MDEESAKKLVASVPHWHHKFEIFQGIWTNGSYDPRFMLDLIGLPQNLSGKTVLDIGTSDGFFARQLFLRGAAVTCIDYRDKRAHGFAVMEQLLNHEFPYHQMNVYSIDADKLGVFDYVLFLGMLYHLPDMVAALVKIRSVCREGMFLETHSEEFAEDVPLARYYQGATLAGDPTNFWIPNRQCVRHMLGDVGFEVIREDHWDDSRFMAVGASSASTLGPSPSSNITRYFAACRPKGDTIKNAKIATAYGLIT